MKTNPKIVVSPDSFKGSLTARQAADAIRKGILDALPDSTVVCLPIADGGEGTLDALCDTSCRKTVTVSGPLGKPMKASFGLLGKTAVVESAEAIGLYLLPDGSRNPEMTTTHGVGELILSAADCGCDEILLTVGGSSTDDGGSGMLEAFGAVFYDKAGKRLDGLCGGLLGEIGRIDLSRIDSRLRKLKFTVACDVTNPLFGKNGATYVYAPQKGADSAMLARLESGMKNYAAALLGEKYGLADLPGAGAAGGLALPLLFLFNAGLRSGIECVLTALDFDAAIADADLVVSGEGKFDSQSLCGKAISGVVNHAAKRKIPVTVFAGATGPTAGLDGVAAVHSLAELTDDTAYSMSHAGLLLRRLSYDVFRSELSSII